MMLHLNWKERKGNGEYKHFVHSNEMLCRGR